MLHSLVNNKKFEFNFNKLYYVAYRDFMAIAAL